MKDETLKRYGRVSGSKMCVKVKYADSAYKQFCGLAKLYYLCSVKAHVA